MPSPASRKADSATAASPLGRVQDEVARRLFDAALAGAKALMSYWKCTVTVASKADGSLVSAADHAADGAVRAELARLGIAAPLISEESKAEMKAGDDLFLLLDPLDGTSEFLDHGEEFCVCLAAVHRGRPVAGAIVAPAMRRAWIGGATAEAVTLDARQGVVARETIHANRRLSRSALIGLVSRRHGDTRSHAAVLASGVASTRTASSAVKFGLLAEGVADVHVRHGRTMTWDIAAGDAVLTAAGGVVSDLGGQPLRYNDPDCGFANPPFVAASRAALGPAVLAAAQRAS